jgi:hypothetical protein
MVCISHVTFAFYVASFLFARDIWLCHGSFDNIRSHWIFESLCKCYQCLTRLFSTWISEWIDVVLFDCVYIYIEHMYWYIIYVIQYTFRFISKFQIFSAWRTSDTFRCSTGIGTDLPWQTEGPRGAERPHGWPRKWWVETMLWIILGLWSEKSGFVIDSPTLW